MLCKVNIMNRISGVIGAFVAVLALSLCLAPLSGCSSQQDDSEVIRQSLSSELDSIKNLDDSFMNEFAESINMSQLSMYGIDGVAFMKSYLDGFDYTIDNIQVDGDTATAQITLTCKSYTGYQQALTEAVTKITENPEELAGLSNEDINKKIGEIVTGSLDGIELKATEPITITYTKVNDTWEPASSTSGDISAALMTN